MNADLGNDIVRRVLSCARSEANSRRLRGLDDDRFSRGMGFGKITVASVYLDADPLLAQAARNELHFLRRYTEQWP